MTVKQVGIICNVIQLTMLSNHTILNLNLAPELVSTYANQSARIESVQIVNNQSVAIEFLRIVKS